MSDYIRRRLSYANAEGGTSIVGEEALLASAAPIVLLGEPGMGKTELMRKLDHPGYRYITARSLVRQQPSRLSLDEGEVLVIDALDEIAAFGEEDAVHEVLKRLSALGFPRFIISCRSAEWRGALARYDITADYGEPPIEYAQRRNRQPVDRREVVSRCAGFAGARSRT